jgi:hypothetical protein
MNLTVFKMINMKRGRKEGEECVREGERGEERTKQKLYKRKPKDT